MQPALLHLVPVVGGGDVPERIGVVVDDELGHPGGAGGEIPEHEVVDVGGRLPRGTRKDGRASRRLGAQVDAVRRDMRPDHRHLLKGFAGGAHLRDVAEQLVVVHRADHLDARLVAAVFDVVRHELEGGRDDHRADAVERQHAHPRLHPLFEHEQDEITLFHAVMGEEMRHAAGILREVLEGVAPLVAVVVHPDERGLFGVFGPLVDHIIGKVEILGHVEAVVRLEILVRVKPGTG